MTKKQKIMTAVAAIVVIAVGAGLGLFLFIGKDSTGTPERYVKNWGSPETWDQHKQNDTVISPQEKSPKENVVTIDFAKCAKGGDSFGFGMGSTSFYFEGISDKKCHFYMGTEIENPRWDGHLNYDCNVPVDYKKDFTVGTSGADLTFVDEYCTN